MQKPHSVSLFDKTVICKGIAAYVQIERFRLVGTNSWGGRRKNCEQMQRIVSELMTINTIQSIKMRIPEYLPNFDTAGVTP